jgi:hypothetical protein
MAEDIAPMILDRIEKTFHSNLKKAGVIQKEVLEKARSGTMKSINQYSHKVGKALANAFTSEITSDILPDGTFYYNIAQKTMIPPLKEAHKMVSDVADEMQAVTNRKIGIGLKPIRPPIEMDRVDGLIDLLTDGFFEDNAHFLDEPIKNLVDHFGDHHVEKNAEFMDNTGVGVVVIRTSSSAACKWCGERAGVYDGYSEAQENEAFSRHEGCRCELEIRGRGTSGKMRAYGHAFVRS